MMMIEKIGVPSVFLRHTVCLVIRSGGGTPVVVRRTRRHPRVPETSQLTAGSRGAVEDDVPVPCGCRGRFRRCFRTVPRAVARSGLVAQVVLVLGSGARAIRVHTSRRVKSRRVGIR